MHTMILPAILGMRKMLTLCAVLTAIVTKAQQPAGIADTRVIIIGVVHVESPTIRTDSLLPIIRAIAPDLLLVESDSISGYFTRDMQLKKIPWYHGVAKTLRIWPDISPEMKATYQYKKARPELVVKPFDQTIHSRRKSLRDWQKQERDFLEAVAKASSDQLLSDALANGLEHHQRQWTFYDSMMDQGYFALNQRAITDSARRMMQWERTLYTALLDSVASLQGHRKNMSFWMQEWDSRNQVMADRILAYITQFPGKTILVHAGALHKYYLYDLLQQHQETTGFRLLEYYDYLAGTNAAAQPKAISHAPADHGQ
jgi:hypothetical protein